MNQSFPDEIYLMIIEDCEFDSLDQVINLAIVNKKFYNLMKINMIELRLYFYFKSETEEYNIRTIRDKHEVSFTSKKDMIYYQYVKTIYHDWLYKYEESKTGRYYQWIVNYNFIYRIPKQLVLEDKYRYTFIYNNVNGYLLEIYDMNDKRYLRISDLWCILKGKENHIKKEKRGKKFYIEFSVEESQDIYVNIPKFLKKDMVINKTSPYNVFFNKKALLYLILILMYRNSFFKILFDKMFSFFREIQ
jgi:hypothetical protein